MNTDDTNLALFVSASDARNRFSELADLAYYQNRTVNVLRSGKIFIKIVKADSASVKPNRDLAPFIGIWAEDGDKIKREMRNFRKNFKFIRE